MATPEKTSIIITAAAGRMGRALIASCQTDTQCQLSAITIRADKASEFAAPVPWKTAHHLDEVIHLGEVVIDFSTPDYSIQNLQNCIAHQRAIVLGTTGFNQQQLQTIKDAALTIPVCMAANFSVGVTLCLKLLQQASQALANDDIDIEIVESHHQHKVDAPSGTALAMGETIANELGINLNNHAVYGRQGDTGVRRKQSIGFHSIRGGDIIGDHSVHFYLHGEKIEINHRAMTRNTFSQGALKAAKWLNYQPAGLYSMEDVIFH